MVGQARATKGAYQGTWYFEVRVDHLGESGHARLGWSTRRGDLQGPVGYDEHSLGYRDLEGSKVHRALREPYGAPFGQVGVPTADTSKPPCSRAPSHELSWL